MMSNNNFYTPEQIRPFYDEIVPLYQTAYAGDPWFEKSKCVDLQLRCEGGFSPLDSGQLCLTCNAAPVDPAYETDELIERFENIAASRPARWYVERTAGIALAAFAWQASAAEIGMEKYNNSASMQQWLVERFDDQPIVWLDEVFANRDVRPTGNLRRFGAMCMGFADFFGNDTVAYRTINPRMIAAAKRNFGDQVVQSNVPDRRDVVVITKGAKQ